MNSFLLASLDWLEAHTAHFWWFAAGVALTTCIMWRTLKYGVLDRLTDLPNRHLLEAYLRWLLWRCNRTGEVFVLLYIDFNDFKSVNDEFDMERKHAAGDDLLQLATARLRTNIQRGDLVARVGGDELVAVLRHINTNETDAESFAARVEGLRALLRSPFKISGRMLKTSVSVGYAMYPDHGTTEASLRLHADKEMYMDKARKPRTYWEAPIHVISDDERVA